MAKCWMNSGHCTHSPADLTASEKTKITHDSKGKVLTYTVSEKIKYLCQYHTQCQKDLNGINRGGGVCFSFSCTNPSTTPVEYTKNFLTSIAEKTTTMRPLLQLQEQNVKALYCLECSTKLANPFPIDEIEMLLGDIWERNSNVAVCTPGAALPHLPPAVGGTVAREIEMLKCTKCMYQGPQNSIEGGRGFPPIICRKCSAKQQAGGTQFPSAAHAAGGATSRVTGMLTCSICSYSESQDGRGFPPLICRYCSAKQQAGGAAASSRQGHPSRPLLPDSKCKRCIRERIQGSKYCSKCHTLYDTEVPNAGSDYHDSIARPTVADVLAQGDPAQAVGDAQPPSAAQSGRNSYPSAVAKGPDNVPQHQAKMPWFMTPPVSRPSPDTDGDGGANSEPYHNPFGRSSTIVVPSAEERLAMRDNPFGVPPHQCSVNNPFCTSEDPCGSCNK